MIKRARRHNATRFLFEKVLNQHCGFAGMFVIWDVYPTRSLQWVTFGK
jgi:hypothetical protein